jgi:hypothetical protein
MQQAGRIPFGRNDRAASAEEGGEQKIDKGPDVKHWQRQQGTILRPQHQGLDD